jgi:hypothetical protein
MTARPGQPQRPPRPRQPRPAEAPDAPSQPATAQVAAAPLPPEPGVQTSSALPQVIRGRLAFPAAALSAPSFDAEIDSAVSYEKGLAIKALLAIALVVLVLTLRVCFFG